MARTSSTAGGRAPPGRKRARTMTAADKVRKATGQDAPPGDWEDAADETDVIPDIIDGLLDRSAANRHSESEARRRIEMLREERLLQQALSDVFELY